MAGRYACCRQHCKHAMHADNTAPMHRDNTILPCMETACLCHALRQHELACMEANTPMRGNSTPVHVGCCKWQRIDIRLATKGWYSLQVPIWNLLAVNCSCSLTSEELFHTVTVGEPHKPSRATLAQPPFSDLLPPYTSQLATTTKKRQVFATTTRKGQECHRSAARVHKVHV